MSQIVDSLIEAQLSRDGTKGGRGTVVHLHCAQMREYGARSGNIQFDCPQDDEINSRGNALARWYKSNNLAAKMGNIFDTFICLGEVLWLILPLDNGDYWIEYFSGGLKNKKPQFKIRYKSGGREIESAVIRYSYEKDSEIGAMGIPNNTGTSTITRWIKLIVTSDSIVTLDCGSEPDLSTNYAAIGSFGNTVTVKPNPFAPVLPIALSVNNPQQTGKQGTGDYHVIASMIEDYELNLANISENLSTFANPTLVTTRSVDEVIEKATTDAPTNTWSRANGFGNMPTDKSIIGRIQSFGRRIKQIVGNVGQDERFGYIQVDPVSGDSTKYVREIRELIHWCLGGVDPIGINTSATFGEIKTLFGRVQNTAGEKANSLLTALCQLFAIAIANEEQRFKANFILAIAQSKLATKLPQPLDMMSDESCQQLYQMYRTGQLDQFQLQFDSKIGLPPMGDRTVNWRYTREVYKPSTRDLLDLSIVGRNSREDGLSQEFTMGRLYPELSPKEIQAATSGFSPRVVENQMNGLNSLLQFYQMTMQLPGSQDPKVPLGIELGLSELITDGVNSLRKELSYGRPVYTAADAASTPASLSEFITSTISNPGADLSAKSATNPATESVASTLPTAGTN